MPVSYIGRAFYNATFFDDFNRIAFYLMIAYTISNDQYLTGRMAMPIASCTRFKIYITN